MSRRWVFGLLLLIAAVAGALLLAQHSRRQLPAMPARPYGGLECGHWAVFRTCELLGLPVAPRQVVEMLPTGRNGHSLKELAGALRALGLEAQGRKESLASFLAGEGVRIVQLTDPDHFIVAVRCGPQRISLFDDRGRHQHALVSALQQRWTGNVLHVTRPAEEAKVAAASQPRLRFSTLFLDLGDIPVTAPGQSVEFVFPLRNMGSAELQVKKVHTTCACLSAKKPEQTIPPGGQADIVLQYAVEGNRRAFVHEAVVETNDPAWPTVVLRAAGNTFTQVAMIPAALNLGEVPCGKPVRRHLLATYSGDEPLTLTTLTSDVPGLELTLKDIADRRIMEEIWPRSHGRVRFPKPPAVIEAIITPTIKTLGPIKGQITVGTAIPHFERLTIPVTGEVVPPVAAAPRMISFGEVLPGGRVERAVRLYSLTERPFRVLAAEHQVAGLECHWPRDAREGLSLSMELTYVAPTEQNGREDRLRLKVESDGQVYDLEFSVHSWRGRR